MLLSEMVRQISHEEELVDDAGPHTSGTAAHDWEDRVSKDITLSAQRIIFIKFTTAVATGNPRGAGRVLVDGTPIVSSGPREISGSTVRKIYLILAAASYTIKFQTTMWDDDSGTGSLKITDIVIGQLEFADRNTSYTDYKAEAQSINDGANSDLINQNITTPADRDLPCGTINKTVVIVTAYCQIDAKRASEMLDDGESTSAGFSGWSILVDDVQYDWDYDEDDQGGVADNLTYGEGAFGRLIFVADPETTYNIKINAANETGGAENHSVYLQIVICPWIIPNESYEPIALDFPQNSTLYLTLEPLELNPTKTVKLGKVRFISFGDSTDYYSTDSGVDRLDYDYTFETVDINEIILKITGEGGCIAIIGVDIR